MLASHMDTDSSSSCSTFHPAPFLWLGIAAKDAPSNWAPLLTCKTWKLLVPGFGLPQLWRLQPFVDWSNRWKGFVCVCVLSQKRVLHKWNIVPCNLSPLILCILSFFHVIACIRCLFVLCWMPSHYMDLPEFVHPFPKFGTFQLFVVWVLFVCCYYKL